MKPTWMKVAAPWGVLAFSLLAFVTINAVAKRDAETVDTDSRPTVTVDSIESNSYQVVISAFGSVQPIETTPIAAQVSGEVSYWHPNFIEGGRVARGDVLFSIEKDAYEAALLQAQAALITARSNLIEQQAQADVAANEAKRNPNKKYTDLFLRKPQLLSAQAQVKSAEAALRIAERDLANCEVYAPYDALVVSKSVGLGQFVSVGAQVSELYNIESAKIVVPIPGFDSAFLPRRIEGLPVMITSQGLLGVDRKGLVVHDLGVVDDATRMSHLMVRVDDPYGLKNNQPELKFGSYVEVNFGGKTLDSVFRLPEELVTNRTVWVVNGDSQLEARKVQVLREESGYFLIGSGLREDDQVVTSLPEYPQAGMAVKVVRKPGSQDRPSATD